MKTIVVLVYIIRSIVIWTSDMEATSSPHAVVAKLFNKIMRILYLFWAKDIIDFFQENINSSTIIGSILAPLYSKWRSLVFLIVSRLIVIKVGKMLQQGSIRVSSADKSVNWKFLLLCVWRYKTEVIVYFCSF